MTEPIRAPFLRRRLGAKLRRMREEAGQTLDSAAPQLDKTRSALQRIESGETRADVHLIRSMMDLYDKYDPNLIEEARRAIKPPWFRAYGIKTAGGFLDVENEASRVDEFAAQVVPGLLQTESYIRALIKARGRDAENTVAIRRIRQARLTSADHPLSLVTVIDEGALRRQVGGPDVMREQLRHLVATAALPTVHLQVLSMDQGAHYAMPGQFIVLAFPEPEDPEYLFIEHLIGTVHSEQPEEVQKARLAFEQLRSLALSPADSVALIERLAVEATPWT